MKNPNHYILDLQMFAEDQPEEKSEKADKVDPEKNYAKAIADLKAKTVSKEDYEKLEEQNKQLLDAIINGGSGQASDETPKEATIEELQKELYVDKKKMSNLEYWTKTLSLRKQLMEKGETDPFTPAGHKVQATATDYLSAENVANGIQECIEASGGDPESFNSELRKRGLDIIPKR